MPPGEEAPRSPPKSSLEAAAAGPTDLPLLFPDARPLAGCLLLTLLCVSTSTQGQKFHVPCKGYTIFPESGIMYWLANSTFVDKLYPDGSVKEEATIEKDRDLTRELIFNSFKEQDFHTKFECIVLDPSGVVRKVIKWDYQDAKGGGGRAPRD
ncbi:interleukin-1 receptor type 2-like isoform X1 [Candoia aspera]|uniref:interleukin-1 receptor type 2-like isoform X1 n=1 Tax=Candoia aspera TaxID=51853 RepID=UPI002FD851D2